MGLSLAPAIALFFVWEVGKLGNGALAVVQQADGLKPRHRGSGGREAGPSPLMETVSCARDQWKHGPLSPG
ncbi:MAG: hypothetical protein U0R72_00315 [Nakamurella multipartita]